MTDRPHVRVILTRLLDRRVRISLYHPYSGRHVPTGVTAGPDEESIELQVLKIKNQLEKNGNHADVREVTR